MINVVFVIDVQVVYVAPLKALVRERIEDWKIRIDENLNRPVVELTGRYHHSYKISFMLLRKRFNIII